MAKVLKIADTRAVIGMDDGSTRSFDLAEFNYDPMAGDEVEIYDLDTDPIITKKTSSAAREQGGNGAGSQNVYVNVQQNAESGRKKVNKIAYCLLAFFLGGLGIHEFYAGHMGRGIAMLLFSWTFIPAIISIVQFFIGLFAHTDANGMIEV